ncbi:MAG TPA: hypothetical protein VKC57_01270, partial [Ktedonobacterales bacterium]|nr:hypothetical protein [Ktedonobacterales bacterium]
LLVVLGYVAGLLGCTPPQFALGPGAAQVRVTNTAADVAGCTPVGNIKVPKDSQGFVAPYYALGQLKNQAVGFGGNAAFVTEGSLSVPQAGIAYHCSKPADAGTCRFHSMSGQDST